MTAPAILPARHGRVVHRALLMLAALLLCGAVAARDRADRPRAVPPEVAELEAAGARIGEIRIVNDNIFDLNDPKEDHWLFRAANALHIRTRPGVIERALLFKTGDPVSVRVFEETERLLRSTRYLYEVQFRVLAVHDGVADIEVATRDTWTLDPGISAGRTGGANSSSIEIKEYNLLGTGMAVSFGRSTNVDRSGNTFELSNERTFGSRVALSYSVANNSDGRRQAISVAQPFYALDTRWSAGVSASDDDRVDAIYNAGEQVGGLRHRQREAEVFGGWSDGLVDGWVRRTSVGLRLEDDRFAVEPGLQPPDALPRDEKLVMPFVRLELIEDRFQERLNYNLVGRPEFFALGWSSRLQLGWASTGLGSSRRALRYDATLSRGLELPRGQIVTAAASVTGRWADGQVERQTVSAQARYYLPQAQRWLFYLGLSADASTRVNPDEALLLGGDTGLRGYPLRYQTGTRRALLTVEERFYTDIYLWQLFRIGGAAFVDVGRAWGGDNLNAVDPGWLADGGFGLRIVNARAAFSNVLHVDVATPLNPKGDVSRVQFSVKSRTSF